MLRSRDHASVHWRLLGWVHPTGTSTLKTQHIAVKGYQDLSTIGLSQKQGIENPRNCAYDKLYDTEVAVTYEWGSSDRDTAPQSFYTSMIIYHNPEKEVRQMFAKLISPGAAGFGIEGACYGGSTPAGGGKCAKGYSPIWPGACRSGIFPLIPP